MKDSSRTIGRYVIGRIIRFIVNPVEISIHERLMIVQSLLENLSIKLPKDAAGRFIESCLTSGHDRLVAKTITLIDKSGWDLSLTEKSREVIRACAVRNEENMLLYHRLFGADKELMFDYIIYDDCPDEVLERHHFINKLLKGC